MTDCFHVKEHIVPCQHIRQSHSTNATQEQTILLSVKQYIPINNASPSPGDITILAAHANGLVKELYEPLWEDLEQSLAKRGRRIRSIWIADVSNQGASGLLNQESLYDDVSWYDHSRDLLYMVNHFRAEMIQPIVAIGHSMGATQLAGLSIIHPRLFSTLVLIDPILDRSKTINMGTALAKGTLRKKVEWPSRKVAEKVFKRALASWNPRVLQKWNKYALHTPETENEELCPTKLVTSRYAEFLCFMSPSFIYNGQVETEQLPWNQEIRLGQYLVELIPRNTIYICGSLSVSAGPEVRKDWLSRTGTRLYLGRRVSEIRVEDAVIPDAGHMVPFEAPTACAETIATWVDEETKMWEGEEVSMTTNWRNLTLKQKEDRANAWMAALKSKI